MTRDEAEAFRWEMDELARELAKPDPCRGATQALAHRLEAIVMGSAIVERCSYTGDITYAGNVGDYLRETPTDD